MRKFRTVTVLAGALSLAAPSAKATTSTANMVVGIVITAGCTVAVTNINFGSTPAPLLASAQASTIAMGGLFSFTCSPGATTPALTAGQGNNYLTSTNRMKGAVSGGFVPYSLAMPTIPTFIGTVQSVQITATIPALSTLPTVDSYTDTVLLTLTY